ncbi:hypothetical protein EBZ37_14660 [bacterium]|nr:hypothetical protein [bacterium]
MDQKAHAANNHGEQCGEHIHPERHRDVYFTNLYPRKKLLLNHTPELVHALELKKDLHAHHKRAQNRKAGDGPCCNRARFLCPRPGLQQRVPKTVNDKSEQRKKRN